MHIIDQTMKFPFRYVLNDHHESYDYKSETALLRWDYDRRYRLHDRPHGIHYYSNQLAECHFRRLGVKPYLTMFSRYN